MTTKMQQAFEKEWNEAIKWKYEIPTIPSSVSGIELNLRLEWDWFKRGWKAHEIEGK